jgi:hypothetical protein
MPEWYSTQAGSSLTSRLETFAGDKRSSLFGLFVGNEEISFKSLTNFANITKLWFLHYLLCGKNKLVCWCPEFFVTIG